MMPGKAQTAHGVHVCNICGKGIRGEYYYSKTRRGSEIYVHKRCWEEMQRERAGMVGSRNLAFGGIDGNQIPQ